ncbi:MAG: KamA family radical SAM protein [Deltaproteobacteria bacterium]|jgi:lysine 2,3-aminomutase|nr:KamA family radical SAM protein [Deltaproteobacteria bacterium]MBW2534777.1 KamA family radical SAM protein [Deltaproteobacteria bacterium]
MTPPFPARRRHLAEPELERPRTLQPAHHRQLRAGCWWQAIPAWHGVDAETFLDYRWQLKNSVTCPKSLEDILEDRVSSEFLDDLRAGLERATMEMCITPYTLSLIDWDDPEGDPIRRQFLPLGSEYEPDHPMGTMDALHEQEDAVAPGLTHRYPDKVLFLALDVCPVYCCCCTRSYSVGGDTERVDKCSFSADSSRWQEAFAYLEAHPEVEDVVVSGGDTSLLRASQIRLIGERLLQIPHIRRIRFATKTLAVMPMKLLSDQEWVSAICEVAACGRKRGVQVCVHTHFNHPDEITEISQRAADLLFQRGIPVRNQSVLLRGVNDDPQTMITLLRRLAWINVEPYYVYLHDVVPGDETLRTSLDAAIELEKTVRGSTAGFMTPTFVCDAYGGGGKRELHSFEHYDDARGIAVYRAPVVDRERPFFYFDPLRCLSSPIRNAWHRESTRRQMLAQAVERAGL